MEKPKATPQKKRRDPYRNLKWLGYKLATIEQAKTLAEYVEYAKFQLCVKNNRLMKDPIWDTYTNEEILLEFYAHQFEVSKEFRIRFEQELGANSQDVDDFAAWADKQMAKDATEREKLMGEAEDKVRFSPNDVMGDDE